MSATSDRARGLARIAAVQAEMAKLAEWKLAAARRRHHALLDERDILAALVRGEDALGAALAKAALRTAKALETRLAEAGADIADRERALADLRRRDKAVASLSREAAGAARREAEAAALAETMEAWLARASLP